MKRDAYRQAEMLELRIARVVTFGVCLMIGAAMGWMFCLLWR